MQAPDDRLGEAMADASDEQRLGHRYDKSWFGNRGRSNRLTIRSKAAR
jgi:hypothetical protein